MRVLTIWLFTILAFVAGGTAASAQGYYAGGQVGVAAGSGETNNTGIDLELDIGPFVSAFFGKDFGNVRVEGELAYRQNDMDNFGGIPVIGEMSSTALMANAYYDFGSGGGLAPYVGAGLGIADVKFESGIDDNDTTLAFQVMGGIAFPLSDSLSMLIELRGFGAYPEFAGGFSQDYFIGSLGVGLRATF